MAEFQAFMQGMMQQQAQQGEGWKNMMQQQAQQGEVLKMLVEKIGGGGGGGDEASKNKDRHWEELKGKSFEMVEKFKGGEAEWHEWSGDFMNLVTTKCEGLGEAMALVKNMAKGEKEVMKTAEVLEALMEDVVGVDEEAEANKKYESIGNI